MEVGTAIAIVINFGWCFRLMNVGSERTEFNTMSVGLRDIVNNDIKASL